MKSLIKKIYSKFILREETLFEVCHDLNITVFELEVEMYRICMFNYGNSYDVFKRKLRKDKFKIKFSHNFKKEPYDLQKEISQLNDYLKEEVRISMYAQYRILKNFILQLPDTINQLKEKGFTQVQISSFLHITTPAVTRYKKLKSSKSRFVKKALDHYKAVFESKNVSEQMIKYRKIASGFLSSWYNGRIITQDMEAVLEKVGILELVQQNKIKEAIQVLS